MFQLADVRESKVFAEGVAEGIEKGMERAIEQVAARLLAKGGSAVEVADVTGLPVARIKRLKKKQTRDMRENPKDLR